MGQVKGYVGDIKALVDFRGRLSVEVVSLPEKRRVRGISTKDKEGQGHIGDIGAILSEG